MNFSLQRSIQVLERTPSVLRASLSHLDYFWTENNYGDKTFSPFDVVGHLVHAERTNWMIRARMIAEGNKMTPFPAFDRYAMHETSKGKDLADLLDEFASERAKNISDLRAMNLDETQLEMQGTHPDFGRVTLRELLATWVVHDLNHLHQIAKSMAWQYREDVGPWRAFLSILPK